MSLHYDLVHGGGDSCSETIITPLLAGRPIIAQYKRRGEATSAVLGNTPNICDGQASTSPSSRRFIEAESTRGLYCVIG